MFIQPLPLTPPPPPFHWTAIPLRSWRSRIFSKLFQIAAEAWTATRFGDLTLPVHFHYASTTLPLRSCCDPSTTMKIWLRLVYADGDLATTLAMKLRFRCAFNPFLNSDTLLLRPRRFHCASTALLPFLLRFVSF